MNPEQALQIVDNATGLLNLNRAQHIEIATAIEVLRAEINKKKEPVKQK